MGKKQKHRQQKIQKKSHGGQSKSSSSHASGIDHIIDTSVPPAVVFNKEFIIWSLEP